MVWCPEQLLQCMLAHIHYMPDHWRGNANKSETRDEVAQLFQYKAVRDGETRGWEHICLSRHTFMDDFFLLLLWLMRLLMWLLSLRCSLDLSMNSCEHWSAFDYVHLRMYIWCFFFCSNQVFILEELLSPIVTPFILIFLLRNKSLEIIDFFRNFTVEVVGVGDICSFAQMDIRRHGNPTVRSVPSVTPNPKHSILKIYLIRLERMWLSTSKGLIIFNWML